PSPAGALASSKHTSANRRGSSATSIPHCCSPRRRIRCGKKQSAASAPIPRRYKCRGECIKPGLGTRDSGLGTQGSGSKGLDTRHSQSAMNTSKWVVVCGEQFPLERLMQSHQHLTDRLTALDHLFGIALRKIAEPLVEFAARPQ